MNNQESTRTQIALALLIAFLGFICGWKMCNKYRTPTQLISTDTIVVHHWDTIAISKPTEHIRYVQRWDTIHSVQLVYMDTNEEPQAIIPIEKAIYHDSTSTAQYTAYVSGYKASLDSIAISCLQTSTIITNTERIKSSRFGVGIQLGVGATASGFSPYIGVGVQYRLWGK